MEKKLSRVVLAVLILALTTVRSASAGPYIDPNTGGMLFQMLAVAFGIVSGLVLLFYSQIKMLLARFARFIREKRGVKKTTEAQENL
jgi:hypothetical protein